MILKVLEEKLTTHLEINHTLIITLNIILTRLVQTTSMSSSRSSLMMRILMR
jgi:hypothetical protein